MNLYLVHPSPSVSAAALVAFVPDIAERQLLECCQILATVDHVLFRKTWMPRADGQPYGAAHPRHPLIQGALNSRSNWELVVDIATELALRLPDHHCSSAVLQWSAKRPGDDKYFDTTVPYDCKLAVVRVGLPLRYAYSREEYATLMRSYLLERKCLPDVGAGI